MCIQVYNPLYLCHNHDILDGKTTLHQLIAEKRFHRSPGSGWRRYWRQLRQLETSCLFLTGEKLWMVLPDGSRPVIKQFPLFTGQILHDHAGRCLLAIPAVGPDPDDLLPEDHLQLIIALEEATRHGPVEGGGLVYLDASRFHVHWREISPDPELASHIIELRDDLWERHVVNGEPLPVEGSPSKSEGQAPPVSDEDQAWLNLLTIQHSLARGYSKCFERLQRNSQNALLRHLGKMQLPPSKYNLPASILTYQQKRDSKRAERIMRDLGIGLGPFRRPYKSDKPGVFNREVVGPLLEKAEKALQTNQDDLLVEYWGDLLTLSLETGPLDLGMVEVELARRKQVDPSEIYRPFLNSSIIHPDWPELELALYSQLDKWFEDRTRELWEKLAPGSFGTED
ncbi:hypothetical protein F4X90_05530 [Candidatus Poribacteria bacterium]|nr:hypothetical protein [Candidatus Poribacteria bacterium]